MIFSVGYLILAVVRWVGKTRRRNMFRKILSQVIPKSSISVQNRYVQSQGISRKFVNNTGQFLEKPLTVCNQVLITAINPKQIVELNDWTKYLVSQGRDTRLGEKTDVTVLLEAVRPDNIQEFLKHQLDLSQAEKIHVLDHGCATAWISGTPFGIIYHCSFEELITLAMGMEDGCLTLNEDLEIYSFKTVDTIGTPSTLIQEQGNSSQLPCQQIPQIHVATYQGTDGQGDQIVGDYDHLAEDLAHTISCEHDKAVETWSNESLASNSSVGRVELLDPSEGDLLDDNKEETDFAEESGSGEGLSEMTREDLNEDETALSQLSAKPPNVLIYTGRTDTVRKFEKVKKVIEQCLDSDCYVIYHLKHEDLETSPWVDNTSLLIINSAKIKEGVQADLFLQYMYAGGKILSLGTSFDAQFVSYVQMNEPKDKVISEIQYRSWNDVTLVCSRYAYDLKNCVSSDWSVKEIARDGDNKTVMVKVTDTVHGSNGCAILSQVLLESDAADMGVTPEIFNQLKKSNAARFEILTHMLNDLGLECSRKSPKPLTAAGLVTKSKEFKEAFLMSIEKRLTKGNLRSDSVTLRFTTSEEEPAEENLLPILTENIHSVCRNFNSETYMKNLESRVLGNTVLYVDVVPTTMPLLDGMMFSAPKEVGMIAIARQQTSGKGRGGNSWLSPVGCAMCTLHVKLQLDTNLGKSVSYLQHITSLAVVYSVCQMDGYKDINLRLKWPNDIYYGRVMKLGGVIVKSTIMDGIVHAIIGCGFNVDNSNPTLCINDIIQSYNKQSGTQLPPCTTEQLLARTVTWIEKLIDDFQKDGPDTFKQKYYEKWLHSDSTVTLQSEGNREVQIKGLDEYGFLLVQTTDGKTISVQPDGNSFDMMKNLITLKTR